MIILVDHTNVDFNSVLDSFILTEKILPVSLRTQQYIKTYNRYVKVIKHFIQRCQVHPEMLICKRLPKLINLLKRMQQYVRKLKQLDKLEYSILQKKKELIKLGKSTKSLNTRLVNIQQQKMELRGALHVCIAAIQK